MQGGGLPTARIALRQPRSGGADERHRAASRLMPRAGARIALAPVALRRAARRLDAGVDHRRARRAVRRRARDRPAHPDRRALRRGRRAGVRRRAASTRASPRSSSAGCGSGATRLPLVPDRPGDPLRAAPEARCSSGSRRATSRCAAGSARRRSRSTRPSARMLGQREFEASGLALRLGRARCAGADQRQHVARHASRAAAFRAPSPAADGKIGRVPLDISDASGKWRFYESDLTIDGGLTVADAADAGQILSAAQRQYALHARQRPDPRQRHAQASGERHAHRRGRHRPSPVERGRPRLARRARDPLRRRASSPRN